MILKTVIPETLTLTSSLLTLDHYNVDPDTITTIGSTLSTSLVATPKIDIYHHYQTGNSYIESLSDEQLASLDSMLSQKNIDTPKTKVLRK